MEAKDMVPVGTKVSQEAREAGNRLCAAHGFSEYDLLQMLYDVAIRTMDDRHNLSYAMEQLIQMFDGMKDWRTSIRLTDPVSKMRIQEAIYILTEAGRTGTRAVHIQGDPHDMFRTEIYNIHAMLERFICLVFPAMYRTLRHIGTDLGTNSVYETLARIVDDYNTNPDADELRIMFSENDYSEQGKRMGEARTKSTRRPSDPSLF